METKKSDNLIGLTALQEKCAVMLAAGSSVTEVAASLDIDRGTIYSWKKKVTFECFLNRVRKESREALQGSLYSLQGQALQALQESLSSDNESTRLKAAVWVIEKLSSLAVGASDPIEVIKAECTEEVWSDLPSPSLNEKKFASRLKAEGLMIGK